MRLKPLPALLAMCCLAILAGPARADYAQSEAWYSGLGQLQRVTLQIHLTLVGEYNRLIDGEFGQGTFGALTAFQKRVGDTPDGVLTEVELDALTAQADEVFGRLGIEQTDDERSGLSISVPTKLFTSRDGVATAGVPLPEGVDGSSYSSPDGLIGMVTYSIPHSAASFAEYYDQLKGETADLHPTYAVFTDKAFTVSGRMTGGSFYARFFDLGERSGGYILAWSPRYDKVGAMLATLTASMTFPIDNAGDGPEDQEAPPDLEDAPEYASGSGFFFADKGMIATNFHVAGSCKSIEVPGYGKAYLIKGDQEHDLAAIQIASQFSNGWAIIRSTPPELAEPVVLLGYPLADLLESTIHVATGIVSAENGMAGKNEWFTTNAGIEPGNSGGPLLDVHGEVIGVAVAKLDSAQLLESDGTTGADVGFGIKNTALISFVKGFDPAIDAHAESLREMTPQQVSRAGKGFTVQVVCEKQPG